MAIKIIKNEDIENSLAKSTRQYLFGDLKKPQFLKHIKDKNIELGISNYSKYSVLDAHIHNKCDEYQIVLKGKSKYLNLKTNEEFEVKCGDVYKIEKHTPYYQKVAKGTRILFFKNPAGNDKKLVKLNRKQLEWGEKYEY